MATTEDPTSTATQMQQQKFFTDTQNRLLGIIPSVVGPLSLLGSGLIIYIIWKDRRQLFKNSYDRIMLGLSVFDVMSSLAFTFLGPWSIPEEDAIFIPGARANSRIPCDLSGFGSHLTIGSILYTAALMIYYMLLVRLEWRPERIAKHVEPWLHGIVISATLVTGVVAVVKDYMNPLIEVPGTCWITDYPPQCELRDEIECIRGQGSLRFVRGLSVLPFITILIVVVAMLLLVLKVRATEQRLLRYRIPTSNSGGRRRRNSSTTESSDFERTRRTAKRGLAYIAAFVVSFLPTAIFNIVFRRHPIKERGAAFLVSLMIVTFIPMQGFFNAIIYIRPKWKELTTKGRSLYFLALALSCMTERENGENSNKRGSCSCCWRVFSCGAGVSRLQREQDKTWRGVDPSIGYTEAPTTNDKEPEHQRHGPTTGSSQKHHDLPTMAAAIAEGGGFDNAEQHDYGATVGTSQQHDLATEDPSPDGTTAPAGNVDLAQRQ